MKRYVRASDDTKYVIVNVDEKEKDRGMRSSYGQLYIDARKFSASNYIPNFTSAGRQNYSRAKLFNSEEEAQAYIDSMAEKNTWKYTKVAIMPYDEAMKNIGDPSENYKTYKQTQEDNRKAAAQAYRERNKAAEEKNKESNPGKYKVWFYYANSWLGGESFTVDADSIDDAFKKAKIKALEQDPNRNASGYDQRMIFNKKNIRKIKE